MQDFHEYYSGKRIAPYLTIFVGGNHEASNYLFELYYGGWVAPNIYYMGAANVIRFGPLRIAGMSGIWKGYDYQKAHHERLPYSQDDVKSVYHVRELDIRKLLNVRSQVDVVVSHDWPRGVEWSGDHRRLFRQKNGFERDSRENKLGNVAAKYVLERLRPPYWFSAHLHVKFAAVINHEEADEAHGQKSKSNTEEEIVIQNTDEIDLDMDENIDNAAGEDNATKGANPPAVNDDEIDLDISDVHVDKLTGMNGAPEPITDDNKGSVPDILRSQLPIAFTQPLVPVHTLRHPPTLPFPENIKNVSTNFLALDKCLPNRHFLQLLTVPAYGKSYSAVSDPLRLQYDKEWLAITRVFSSELVLGDINAITPPNKGDEYYRPLIEKEEKWVEDNLEQDLYIPEDFEITAPVYDEVRGINNIQMPREYTNPHTKSFCEWLGIEYKFDTSEEERDARMERYKNDTGSVYNRSNHNSHGGRGRGRGRGRGGGYRQRGGSRHFNAQQNS